MKKTNKLLGILLSCVMLLSLLSVGVFAATGTQDDPINANDKWFGYGVDCFLLNTTLEAGDADGIWYELTADTAGILQVEHTYNNVDYYLTVRVNGTEYKGYADGVYYRPIATYPVSVGDVITIHLIAQDTTLGGTVYCNAKFVTGQNDQNNTIKVKSAPAKAYVAAGATVYYQDDSLQAEYATKGLLVSGDSVEGITVTTGSKDYADTDGDGVVELKLGGSLGSAGAPAVKPSWAITNTSDKNVCLTLTTEDTAHECVYTDDNDADCNTCGAMRDVGGSTGCSHEYLYPCDATCMLCGEFTNPDAAHKMTYVEAVEATCTANGNIGFYTCDFCGGCWDNFEGTGMPLNRQTIVVPGGHVYDHDFDADCNHCGEVRFGQWSVTPILGTSVSEDVNGLAIQVKANIGGIQVDGKTALYDDAFVNDFKLVGMGAVVSNDGTVPSMETVDDSRVLNIPAVYLSEFDAEHDGYYYTIRIVDIPENHKDTIITFRTYFIYEDSTGAQQIVYDDLRATSYHEAR